MKVSDLLFKLYESDRMIKSEVDVLIKKLRNKIKSAGDAVVLTKLADKNTFYYKHDLFMIKELCDNYNENTDTLFSLIKKYIALEDAASIIKSLLAKIGLTNISFGPASLNAIGMFGANIALFYNDGKLEISVEKCNLCDGKDSKFNDYGKNIKNEIKRVLLKKL